MTTTERRKGSFIIKTVSIPSESAEVLEKLLEILKRDRKSLSAWFREHMEEDVKRREPGNPQRPITAFVDGHPDHLRAAYQKVLRRFLEYGEWREISYKAVIRELRKEGLEPSRALVSLADEIFGELHKAGRRVYR